MSNFQITSYQLLIFRKKEKTTNSEKKGTAKLPKYCSILTPK